MLDALLMGGGRNVEFHYYDWPFFSEHQKCLFSSSLLLHQNIESLFLVDHNYKIAKIRTSKLTKITTTKVVDHFYENQNVEKNKKNIKSLSFVWFSHLNYLWQKYLWHFGIKKSILKNFLTWLNLTLSNLT